MISWVLTTGGPEKRIGVVIEPENYMLGELLTFFEVVHEKDVKRGLILSKHTGLPLGKCLVMLDVVTPEVVRAAVEAQSMLKDELKKRWV